MKFHIDISNRQYRNIWKHLLPLNADRESAAFLFAEMSCSDSTIVMKARDYCLVDKSGFKVQRDDFIELSDEMRISIIKKAHMTRTALIELHSHPFSGQWAAAFSIADMMGFKETVPHMWWRLPGRPYAAIVAAYNGFDALIWHENPHQPENVTSLRVADKVFKPTNRTLGEKNGIG